MINIKINDKPYKLETCWEEVSFGKFIRLLDAKTTKDILHALLDIPKEELDNARIDGLETILRHVQYLKKEPAIYENPDRLGPFEIPKEIGFETLEQYEETRNELARVSKLPITELVQHNRSLALYAAIYLQKPFDIDRARELAKSFDNHSCLEVMSVGNFMQAKCLSMESNYTMSYLRKNTLMKRKRPGLDRFMRRLGFTAHLTPSHGM